MKATTATAPAKLILLGEHAVVYGQPAIAVPLKQLCAEVTVTPTSPEEPVSVALEDFEHHSGRMITDPAGGIWGTHFQIPAGINMVSPEFLASAEAGPFIRLFQLATADDKVPDKGWRLQVRSRIPIGCGLGSSAAVCAAAFRAIHDAFDVACAPEQLAQHVYETERILHGTPSGIDNTVIALEQAIVFQRGAEIRLLQMPASEACLVVGYSGIHHKTREIVADVRKSWTADKATFDAIFEDVGQCAREGAQAIEAAEWPKLGQLMNRNQTLLERMGVSCEKLETLVQAARNAGALGAKLSGAGRGGCMVALAENAEQAKRVQAAIEQAGATMCITSEVAR
ncbi:MAG TPA: mevalonate kinase [Planctomycetota bacterium]|jgi:mevalonate kinase